MSYVVAEVYHMTGAGTSPVQAYFRAFEKPGSRPLVATGGIGLGPKRRWLPTCAARIHASAHAYVGFESKGDCP